MPLSVNDVVKRINGMRLPHCTQSGCVCKLGLLSVNELNPLFTSTFLLKGSVCGDKEEFVGVTNLLEKLSKNELNEDQHKRLNKLKDDVIKRLKELIKTLDRLI